MSKLLPLTCFAAAVFVLPSLALADIPPDSDSDSGTDTGTSTDTGTTTTTTTTASSGDEEGEDEAKGCSLGADPSNGALAFSFLVLCGAGLSLRRRPR